MSEENKLLTDENQRLHQDKLEIAEVNVNLLSLLEKEKSKMPVRLGRSHYAVITAVLLLIGGYFSPLVTLDLFGSKLPATNLLQVCGVALLIVTFIGPFIISAIAAFKGTTQKQ
jgi:hypothetical protein